MDEQVSLTFYQILSSTTYSLGACWRLRAVSVLKNKFFLSLIGVNISNNNFLKSSSSKKNNFQIITNNISKQSNFWEKNHNNGQQYN